MNSFVKVQYSLCLWHLTKNLNLSIVWPLCLCSHGTSFSFFFWGNNHSATLAPWPRLDFDPNKWTTPMDLVTSIYMYQNPNYWISTSCTIILQIILNFSINHRIMVHELKCYHFSNLAQARFRVEQACPLLSGSTYWSEPESGLQLAPVIRPSTRTGREQTCSRFRASWNRKQFVQIGDKAPNLSLFF